MQKTLRIPIKQIQKKDKKRPTHGNLAITLINAAVSHIEKSKTIDFALRELAKQIGVSHAAAYKHFESKQDLLLDIARRGFAALNTAFEAIDRQGSSYLHNLGEAYILFGLQNPGYYRVMFGFSITNHLHSPLEQECQKSLLKLVEAFGPINKSNMLQAFHAWSTVHGFVMLHLDGQFQQPMKQLDISEKELLKTFVTMASKIPK